MKDKEAMAVPVGSEVVENESSHGAGKATIWPELATQPKEAASA